MNEAAKSAPKTSTNLVLYSSENNGVLQKFNSSTIIYLFIDGTKKFITLVLLRLLYYQRRASFQHRLERFWVHLFQRRLNFVTIPPKVCQNFRFVLVYIELKNELNKQQKRN